jgi:hypothetical protein
MDFTFLTGVVVGAALTVLIFVLSFIILWRVLQTRPGQSMLKVTTGVGPREEYPAPITMDEMEEMERRRQAIGPGTS